MRATSVFLLNFNDELAKAMATFIFIILFFFWSLPQSAIRKYSCKISTTRVSGSLLSCTRWALSALTYVGICLARSWHHSIIHLLCCPWITIHALHPATASQLFPLLNMCVHVVVAITHTPCWQRAAKKMRGNIHTHAHLITTHTHTKRTRQHTLQVVWPVGQSKSC